MWFNKFLFFFKDSVVVLKSAASARYGGDGCSPSGLAIMMTSWCHCPAHCWTQWNPPALALLCTQQPGPSQPNQDDTETCLWALTAWLARQRRGKLKWQLLWLCCVCDLFCAHWCGFFFFIKTGKIIKRVRYKKNRLYISIPQDSGW